MVNKRKKIARIIDSDDESPNKNDVDDQQTTKETESEIQSQKNLAGIKYFNFINKNFSN